MTAPSSFRHILQAGNLTLALQPDRGHRQTRKGDYHDSALPPRHAYVAFYLWLRASEPASTR